MADKMTYPESTVTYGMPVEPETVYQYELKFERKPPKVPTVPEHTPFFVDIMVGPKSMLSERDTLPLSVRLLQCVFYAGQRDLLGITFAADWVLMEIQIKKMAEDGEIETSTVGYWEIQKYQRESTCTERK